MPRRLWLERQRWYHDFMNGRGYKDEMLAASASWEVRHAFKVYYDDEERFGYLVRKLRQFLWNFVRRGRWRRLIKLVEYKRRMELENVARRLDF